MDEGLLLWMNVVSQASEMNNALLSIFPNAVTIMDQTFEHTKVIMRIIEEYLLTGKADFVKVYGTILITLLQKTIGNVKDEAAVWIAKPIEIFIQLFPKEAPAYLEPVLQQLLSESFKLSESSPWVVVHYISLFARILLQNPEFFFQIFGRLGMQHLNSFLELWLEKFETMGQQKMKKLNALAMCQLLATKQREILSFVNQILAVGISVANFELDRTKEDDSLELWNDNDEELTTKSAAKQMLYTHDPAATLNAYVFLVQKLNECIALNGEAIKSAIDPTLFSQLQALSERRKMGQ
jgi:hypothetical protein